VSSWAAKVEALARLLLATSRKATNLDILIDNKAVVTGLQQALAGRFPWPKYGFGRWVELRDLLHERHHRAFWVPSHGKRRDWRAADNLGSTTQKWRDLNDAADKDATKGLAKAKIGLNYKQYLRDKDFAKKWANTSFERLYQGIKKHVMQNETLWAKWGDTYEDL